MTKTIVKSNTDMMHKYAPDTYGTYLWYELIDLSYDAEEMGIDSDDIDINHDQFKLDLCEWLTDWIIENVNEELPDYIKFVKPRTITMVSPKFYNFATDSMNVELSVDIDKMMKKMDDDQVDFDKFLAGNYTSRDGFMSYMPNSYMLWKSVDDTERQVMCVVNYLLDKMELDNPLYDFDSCIVYDNLVYPDTE